MSRQRLFIYLNKTGNKGGKKCIKTCGITRKRKRESNCDPRI